MPTNAKPNGGVKGLVSSISTKTNMNTTKIVGLTVLGGLVLGGGALLSNVLEVPPKTVKLKTVAVKHMPRADLGILQSFHKMENEIMNFLPEDQRPLYTEMLDFCIRNAESILLLEKLAATYTEAPSKIASQAQVHYKYASSVLDRMAKMFKGIKAKTVQEHVDYLKDSLQEHLQNLDNMGYDYYFANV